MVMPTEYGRTQGQLHVPVLLSEAISYLNPRQGNTVIDCTVGLGGHAAAICALIGPQGTLVALDKDEKALSMARETLDPFPAKKFFIHKGFEELEAIARELSLGAIQCILFDLGISSFELEDQSRGFSFQTDAPLDMRFDAHAATRAYDLVNAMPEEKLALTIATFGEERFAKRIARAICRARMTGPIKTTGALRDIIIESVGRYYRGMRIHCATRTFQALRIAVNGELEHLTHALPSAFSVLAHEGRMCVIAYHSLEDRIVKQFFRAGHTAGTLRILTKKPVQPEEEEVVRNPRARSAKLRAVEKL